MVLGLPDDFAEAALGVRLDPIARRGVIAALSAAPAGPGQATLDASGSQVPAGAQSWSFDLDGDAVYETGAAGPTITRTLPPGPHTIGVRVVDVDGDADTAQATVAVSPPVAAPGKKCGKRRKLVRRKGKLRCVKKKKKKK